MRLIFVFPLLAMSALAQPGPAQSGSAQPSLGFSTANMDMTANPCIDFYQYACGTWMANNPIPADQSAWGTFNELNDRNLAVLHGILDKASVDDPKRSAVEQKIGDFYASCMDEAAINMLGIKALEPQLKRIDEIGRAHV